MPRMSVCGGREAQPDPENPKEVCTAEMHRFDAALTCVQKTTESRHANDHAETYRPQSSLGTPTVDT